MAIFDPLYDNKKVNLNPEKGLVAGSAVNFYDPGITESEVDAYYASIKDNEDPRPISYGLNSKLIRNKNGDYLVLEDNLRVPSGVSYMLENRMVMRDVFPELFTRYKVASIHQYTNKLFNCMNECIPKKTAHPHMVVLPPGIYNSAYFEHSFLAEQMGIALVEGKDLFVHMSEIKMDGFKTLKEGAAVNYEEGSGEKGPCATNVTPK